MRYKMIKKRRRLALTDYRKRVALLLGNMPRVVIRKSNRGITMQIVAFEPKGDKVITGVSSKELAKYGWSPRSNTPTAYLTGLALAQKAKSHKFESLVIDIGLYKPGKASVIFAAARGAADGGLKILNNITFDEKRIKGAHISNYARLIKPDNNKYKKQFSAYEEAKLNPEMLEQLFEATKKKIMA
jgi:large subunit ribosomal protein L18